MYNTDLPRRADLPTSAQLTRSTWIAGVTATAILTFIVLPSEYAIDPTGVGGMLGLTQMGEIKTQLAEEAAQDAAGAAASSSSAPAQPAPNVQIAEKLSRIEGLLVQIADGQMVALPAAEPEPTATAEPEVAEPATEQPVEMPIEERLVEAASEPPPVSPANEWRDELSITLIPGEGTEIKLVMEQGEQAEFFWTANGATVNYDTHGDGGGNSISYEKGRGVAEQEGILEAAFTGNHGWFWRNRTDADVTLTLRTRGSYSEMKRAM